MKLAILTATFNRAFLLERLYHTLCDQTDKDFVWIVIDDGSTDQTKEIILSFTKSTQITIHYVYQLNGGKARAINQAFSMFPDIDFFAVVDSDDYLLKDGVAFIKNKVNLYEQSNIVGAIFFRYLLIEKKQKIIGQSVHFPQDQILSRREHDAMYGKYDGCVGYYRRAAQAYRYPEYSGEQYMGPTVLQMLMDPEYKIAFTDCVVGCAAYLAGGLSLSGRKLRIKNSLGMLHYSILLQSSTKLGTRLKYAVFAQAYSCIAQKQQKQIPFMLQQSLKWTAKLPGVLLGNYWAMHYKC